MSDLIRFDYGDLNVRVIIDEHGNPLFVAKDACEACGLVWKGSEKTGPLGALDEDEKGVGKIETPGGAQNVIVVNESGLYTMIIRSNKPAAKVFRRWITHDVLPSIRKTGGYTAPRGRGRKRRPAADPLADQVRSSRLCLSLFQSYLSIGRSCGLPPSAARLAALDKVRSETGVDLACDIDLDDDDPGRHSALRMRFHMELFDLHYKLARKVGLDTVAARSRAMAKVKEETGVDLAEEVGIRQQPSVAMRQADVFNDFVDDCLAVPEGDCRPLGATVLYELFTAYLTKHCGLSDRFVPAQRWFASRMMSVRDGDGLARFSKEKKGGIIIYHGVALQDWAWSLAGVKPRWRVMEEELMNTAGATAGDEGKGA